jgi:hypothetical protein
VSEQYRLNLFDLGLIIKERALDARRKRDELPRKSGDRDFQSGRVIAFNEVISIMQQQAQGFGIALTELRLDDIEPDRDLV